MVCSVMGTYAKPESSDDPAFVAWVETTIKAVAGQFATDQTYVVKIDHWFGKRWLGFSGKFLGAVGMRKSRLTLPPFVPSRVVSQRRFVSTGVRSRPRRRLHVWQRSGENLQRYTEIVVHDSTIFWYSGGTAERDRASFMAYVLTNEGHWPWYVGLRRTDSWRVVEAHGISPIELREFVAS